MEALAINVPSAVLNNSAIAYLQTGRADEAMMLLQIALANLRDQFVERRDRDGEGPCEDKPIEEDDVDQSMDSEDKLEPCSKQASSISVFGSVPFWIQQDASFLTLYDRALLVDTDIPCEDDELLSAVILFNMALLHHSAGLQCGKSDFLERASRLYQIALNILQKQHDPNANYLLLMALFNNIAHIDSHLFRMEDMKDSLEQMRNILTADDIDDEDLPIEEDDYVIFFMNAMFGKEKEFTVAPAA